MKQPTSEVKQAILTKLTTFMRQLTRELIEKKTPLEDVNGLVGMYMFELQKTYGPEAVLHVTNELNKDLWRGTPLSN